MIPRQPSGWPASASTTVNPRVPAMGAPQVPSSALPAPHVRPQRAGPVVSKVENHDEHDTATNDLAEAALDANLGARFPFGFPFPPYTIQVDLMRAMKEALNDGAIALLESPTGTGKSLSLICGSLSWLADNWDNPALFLPPLSPVPDGAEEPSPTVPAWVRDQARQLKANQALSALQEFRRAVRTRIDAARQRAATLPDRQRPSKRARSSAAASIASTLDTGSKDNEDDDLILDDHFFDGDDPGAPSDGPLQRLCGADDDDALLPLPTDVRDVQIVYASRTHSQINQFVRELAKTQYARRFTSISLAGRKHLCINPAVLDKAQGHAGKVNDLCLDLQKSATARCPYLPADDAGIMPFHDHALAQVHDIEDLGALGTRLGICPYYGARRAVASANLVAIPYASLVHAPTRDALGVSVANNVVIIDEAHNLIDVINAAMSVTVCGAHVERTFNQLTRYTQKYRTRLSARNVMHIKHLLALLAATHKFMKATTVARMLPVNQFLFALELDHVNPHSLAKYLAASQLARKLHGFVDKYEDAELAGGGVGAKHVSPLSAFESFLMKLAAPDADGRVLFTPASPECKVPQLQYLSLNPAAHFEDIVRDARALVLASGTLAPIADLTEYLLPNRFGKEVVHFACGHIVPDKNLAAMVVPATATGREIKLTMSSWSDPAMLDGVAQVVLNLATVVPRGMVVFVPSFGVLDQLLGHMRKSDLLMRLERRKQVFQEPRDAQELEKTLREYAQHIDSTTTENGGAVLFSVVNGKMSEGINFSDDLARCVVMLGLPFPNKGSLELQEKLAFIESSRDRAAANDFYINLCMRAVNQSIGRAIRHANDYAAIVLCDVRYHQPEIRAKLPGWITERMDPPPPAAGAVSFGTVVGRLARFFREHRG
ncbi:ATP-dependent DNA helicase chl1 [Allomyces javanicus]|nr:ATP-dependent DNA helicase chl1 [Allomyces javanicus]